MTVADLIQEAKVYEYSNERLELMKECAEIEIMNQFLESARYRDLNGSIVESVQKEFGSNYFVESASENDIVEIQESIKTKASNVWASIKRRVKKLWDALCAVVNKTLSKLDGTVIHTKSIIKAVNKKPELVNQLIPICYGVAKTYSLNDGILAATDGKELGFSDAVKTAISKVEDPGKEPVKAFYQALSISKITLDVKESETVIPMKGLSEIVDKLLSVKSKADAASLKTYIENMKKVSTLSVPVAKRLFDNDVKALTAISNKLGSVSTDASVSQDKMTTGAENMDPERMDYMADIEKISTDIINLITQEIAVIRQASMFKLQAVAKMGAAIEGKSNSSDSGNNNGDKKDDQQQQQDNDQNADN